MNKRLLMLFGLLLIMLITACSAKEENSDGTTGTLTPPTYIENSEENSTTEDAGDVTEQSSEAQEPQNGNAKIYVNGNRIATENIPYVEQDDIMVPAIEILSYFSRDISADISAEKVVIKDPGMETEIEITGGENKATINGNSYSFILIPVLHDDEIYIEAASFATLFDCQVKYNNDKNIVYITESGLC